MSMGDPTSFFSKPKEKKMFKKDNDKGICPQNAKEII